MNKHIPDWAFEIYCIVKMRGVMETITPEEWSLAKANKEVDCLRSQLVAEYLMKRNWIIK